MSASCWLGRLDIAQKVYLIVASGRVGEEITIYDFFHLIAGGVFTFLMNKCEQEGEISRWNDNSVNAVKSAYWNGRRD